MMSALPEERHASAEGSFVHVRAEQQQCRQLVSEQEVQARAADAARANVELHYAHICHAYSSFMTR
eukprot:scaffold109543_cov19-Tisochrysis_lutea.AAC.2